MFQIPTFIFPLISSLTGANAVDPRTSEKTTISTNYHHFIRHCDAFCGLKWRCWWAEEYLSPLAWVVLNDRGLGLKHICQHALYCFIVYELALGLRYDSNQRSTILQKGKSVPKVHFVVPFYRCNFIWKAEAISCEHCRFVVCLHAPKSQDQRSRAYSLALYTLISVYTFSILFPMYFLRNCPGVFVPQSRAF